MRWCERLAAGVAVAVSLASVPAGVLAATPTPEALGDPRSAGEGPGLVGDPLTAVLIVIVIGLVALAATLAYIRATGGRGGPTA